MSKSFFTSLLAIVLVFVAGDSQSATYFSWECKLAYQSLMNLDFEAAEAHLETERKENPDNIFVPYLLHYSSFVKHYVRPEPESLDELFALFELYENEIVSNTTANGYWKDFFEAELMLQKALVQLNEQNYIAGFFQLRSTYLFSKEVVSKAVIEHPAEKTLAVTEALFSVVPDNYHWVLRLLSIDASLPNAQKKLVKLSENPMMYFQQECVLLSAALDLHLGGNAKDAYYLLKSERNKHVPLFKTYLLANTANYAGMNDTALQIMESVPFLNYQRFPLLFHLRGKLYLQKLDPLSEKWLKYFLSYNQVELLVKNTYQYLAWNAILKDDTLSFKKYKAAILENGNANGGADKAAEMFASEKGFPDLSLLRARLLFDGGYYQQALDELQPENQEFNLEKDYRLGRIYHALGNYDKALFYYKKVLSKAKLSGSYLPANSAYLCGQIYTEKKQYEEAKSYFEMVFEYQDHPYKMSLDQKAKASIRAIKK